MINNHFFNFISNFKMSSSLESSELKNLLMKFKREFLWVGFFSFISNLLMLSPTLYMLQIYDRVFISRSELTLLSVSLIIFGFLSVMAFSEFLRSRLLVRVGLRIDEVLNSRIFNASFNSYISQNHLNPSEAITKLTYLRQFITSNGIIAIFDLPWTPIYIGVIFILHPWLGYLSILFTIIQFILAIYSSKTAKINSQRLLEVEGKSRDYLYSKLKNFELVNALGMIGNLTQRWSGIYKEHLFLQAKLSNDQNRLQSFIKGLRYFMQSLTLGFGAMLVIDNQLSLGAMIAVNVVMSRALSPLDQLISSWHGFLQAKESYLYLEQLLKKFPMTDPSRVLVSPVGEVRIENFSAYTPNNHQILSALNAEFKSGSFNVIVGHSGSGKSTLAKCIVGVWPNQGGNLMLDGVNISQIDRDSLGPFIGYLPQNVDLLEGTVAENISRFYHPNPDLIVGSAKKAGIHEMILSLPNGYDTVINDSTILISGGQRQRLGLARALYGNPRIVVLDEPNANLDEAGEKALVSVLSSLRSDDVTVFVITHRINTFIKLVDNIVELKGGKISNIIDPKKTNE